MVTLEQPIGSNVIPGDKLGSIRDGIQSGEGTYLQKGKILASVVGTVALDENLVTVTPRKPIRSKLVPQVGQVVLVRIVRITQQRAVCDIMALPDGSTPVEPWEATLRLEDVTSSTTEKWAMEEAYLPGDWILARILALGDARRYHLTTAEASLGVVYALSRDSQEVLKAVSYKEMECPTTGRREPRKCARPPSLSP